MEKIMGRMEIDEYFLEVAKTIAKRSTCIRAIAGAVIVKEGSIISAGYSGSAKGEPNCCDVGVCERQRLNIAPGSNYELCKSVHAEANAIINAARHNGGTEGAKMYLYFERLDGNKTKHNGSCIMCSRMIKNAGIKEVIFTEVV